MRIVLLMIVAVLLGAGAGIGIAYRGHRDQGELYQQLMEVTSLAPVPQAKRERRVIVENGAEFDFGVMAHNDTKSHTFRIRNNTDQPLTLTIVEKTCKCTIGHLPHEAIPPGEVGEVELEWTAKEFQSDFRQSATLQTSDPVQSIVTLVVLGHVMQLVSVSPPDLAFTDVSFGVDAEQQLTIRSYEDPKFVIERVTWLNEPLADDFEVTFEPVSPADPSRLSPDQAEGEMAAYYREFGLPTPRIPEPQSVWSATVRLKAGIPLGRFDQRLILHTNSATVERLEVPLFGNVVSDVQIVGKGFRGRERILELGVVPAREGITRELKILTKGAESQSFEIKEVVADPEDCLKVTVGQPVEYRNGAVRHFPMEVAIPAGSRTLNRLGINGRPSAKIVIRTTHPIDREITIDTRFAIVDR
jgi:hypothetical protein